MEQPTPPRQDTPLKIRSMTLDDIPRVHEIDLLSFSLPWPEKSFTYELTQNPSALVLVAELTPPEVDPTIVGMAVVWIIIDEAHIATIAIHPDFRGRGYGKFLLAETLRQSIDRGALLATLEVRSSNLVAQKMYQKFGFSVVGLRAQYYRDNNEDAVIMTVEPLGSQYRSWLDRIAR
jgi:ribosomal-protein-alanine N-acetyltransferase